MPALLASDAPKFLVHDQVLSSACHRHPSLRVHEGTIDRADIHNTAMFFQLCTAACCVHEGEQDESAVSFPKPGD